MSAKELCNELGFEPEEATEAHELVQNRIRAIDNWSEQITSRSITRDVTVHLNQLLRDTDGDAWVVTDLHKHAIELNAISRSSDGTTDWGEQKSFTPGDIVMDFDPQFETVDGQQIPVWVH